jgi:GNAT superfamily N-acetyltransferase
MPQSEITLRPGTAEDVPSLLSLMDAVLAWLVTHGRSEQWGTTPFSQVPGFSARVAHWVAQGVITVAERDGRCVGVLAAAPTTPPRVPAGMVPEGSMFVYTVLSDRGSEGRGVGRALLNAAERLATERGCPAVALDHWAGSAELARIYDDYGYIKVCTYIDNHDGNDTRNVVRVRLLPKRPVGG